MTARTAAPPILLRRGDRPGDLRHLADLTADTATPLGTADLERLVLGDPDLARAALLVAEIDGTSVGYVHVACSGDCAWIVSAVVARQARGSGVGSALWDAALAHARSQNTSTLRISGYPPGYVSPGVDLAADPATSAFLRGRGATEAGEALAMEIPLPAPVADPAPSVPGVSIGTCAPEEVPGVLSTVRRALNPDWASTLHRHVASGGSLERLLVARDTARRTVLGVAAWGVVGTDPGRFGPIGVTPAARGRGVGGALLDHALTRMTASRIDRAWFLWTGAGSAAHRLYLSRGFRPLSTTTLFSIDVPHGAPERTAP